MKALLTTIIIIISVTTSFVLIKRYRTPNVNTTTMVAPADATPMKPINVAKITRTIDLSSHPSQLAQIDEPKKQQIAGLDVSKLISVASSQGLKPKALKSALNAYSWALNHHKLGKNKEIITVVDFTLPSYEKRMWVLNLRQNKVLMKLHTTQGSGSGVVYANRFSNVSRSQASSLGLYVTAGEYYGKHGKSMRLDGLQKGINHNALNRAIVIHEAGYASPEYIRANHRAGRSWGCFAIAPASKNVLLNYVKGGSALFAYANSIEKTPIISNGPLSV